MGGSSCQFTGWPNSFSRRYGIEVPVFRLASSQGGLSAPRGHLQFLATWPPEAVYKIDICFLPGQLEPVSLTSSSVTHQEKMLLLKGSPDETKPIRVVSLLPCNIIKGVIVFIIFPGPSYIQRGKDSLRIKVAESQLGILQVSFILVIFFPFCLAASRLPWISRIKQLHQ